MKPYQHAYLMGPSVSAALVIAMVAIFPSKSGYEALLVYILPIVYAAVFVVCLVQYWVSVGLAVGVEPICKGWKSHFIVLILSAIFGFLAGLVVFGWLFSASDIFSAGIIGSIISFSEGLVLVAKSVALGERDTTIT